MERQSQKETGAYYTPDSVATSLIQWVVRQAQDRMLDPSCGDGRFIAGHPYSVGIEQNPEAVRQALARAPWAHVYEEEFFTWASTTTERPPLRSHGFPHSCGEINRYRESLYPDSS
jgi:adenine-specific DNA-methyltransferase